MCFSMGQTQIIQPAFTGLNCSDCPTGATIHGLCVKIEGGFYCIEPPSVLKDNPEKSVGTDGSGDRCAVGYFFFDLFNGSGSFFVPLQFNYQCR